MEPSPLSQIAIPVFWMVLSLALPIISRHDINVWKALIRYDDQAPDLSPVSAYVRSEDEGKATTKKSRFFSRGHKGLREYIVIFSGALLAIFVLERLVGAMDFSNPKAPQILLVVLGCVMRGTPLFQYPTPAKRTIYVRRHRYQPGISHHVSDALFRAQQGTQKQTSWLSAAIQVPVEIAWTAILGIVVFKTGLLLSLIVGIRHYFYAKHQGSMRCGIPLIEHLVLLAFAYGCAVMLYSLLIWCAKPLIVAGASKLDPAVGMPDHIAAVGNLVIRLLFSLGPIYHVAKAACQYDLARQRNGSAGQVFAIETDNLPMHQAEMEKAVDDKAVLRSVLDINGKRPEPVEDSPGVDARVPVTTSPSKIPFWFRYSVRSSESVQLPIFDCAVDTLRVLAGLALLYVLVCIHRSSQPHWLAQMQLGPLFSRALFEGGPRDSETALVHLFQVFHSFIFLILSIVVSTCIYKRHDMEGVRRFWFGEGEKEEWLEGPLLDLLGPDPWRPLAPKEDSRQTPRSPVEN
ncbi:hypothetical protein OC846_005954 [Tilletia horrida]|uniref:Uncharacterized protein n=1 Tax=Tilletia horrida TaxID=155126 RepID=A0AAN6JPR9_9BASI|nr:hypothetical protein OC846_005954 [Tilletia horrida]